MSKETLHHDMRESNKAAIELGNNLKESCIGAANAINRLSYLLRVLKNKSKAKMIIKTRSKYHK